MKLNITTLTLGLLGIYALSGCTALVVGGVAAGATTTAAVATDPRSGGGVIDDQDLRGKVKDMLKAALPGNDIEVTSYHQNILLSGQVKIVEQKIKAERVTHEALGVRKVYNYIEVGNPVSSTSKDAYLTSAIKSKLLVSKGVNSNDIKVVTTNATVYLLGMVDAHQAKKIERIVSKMDGVKKVVGLFEYVNEK